MTKRGSLLKNCDSLCTLEGYWHSLPIIGYKHQRYQGGLLMVNYIGMYTKSQKKNKMRIETIIGLCGKGNEIILGACSM